MTRLLERGGGRLAWSALAALAMGAGSTNVQAATVYSNNFDAPATTATGVIASGFTNGGTASATVGAWNAAGWSGSFFINASTGNPALVSTLTLTGLVANSAVSISGILGLLDSWDSNNNGPPYSPDYLDVYINGTVVASLTTNTALGTIEILDGATKLYDGVQADSYSTYYSDVLLDISTANFASAFADATGTFTLGFGARGAGWQGGTDENWGIDNLSIEGTAAPVTPGVPEPASWAMMIAGFGIAGAAMRRRRAATLNFAL